MEKHTYKNGKYVAYQGMDLAEAQTYFEMYNKDKVPQGIDYLVCVADGDEVNITYKPTDTSFERIRRITGYLVGTVDRWNDGKQAELKDRTTNSFEVEQL